MPSLYIIIILSAIFTMNFWLLTLLIAFFSWTSLVGVVRAEFLRARNFEYVRAARALGVGNVTIMFRHMLPNAMVATLTLMPFLITGAIGGLAALDFLGLGLPPSYPSLGELALQGKNRLNAPWLGFTAFFTFAFMLSPARLHLRGRPRRLRPAKDLPVTVRRPAHPRLSYGLETWRAVVFSQQAENKQRNHARTCARLVAAKAARGGTPRWRAFTSLAARLTPRGNRAVQHLTQSHRDACDA